MNQPPQYPPPMGYPPQPQYPAPQGYPPQQPPMGYPPQPQYPAPQGYPQQPPMGYPPQQPAPQYPAPAYPQAPAPQPQGAGDWTALIGEATLGNRGGENFIGLDGHAVIDVECVKVIQSIDSGPMLIVEFAIVEAAMIDSKTGLPEVMQPGEKRSWGAKLQTKPGAADALEWHHHVLRFKLREQFNPNTPLTREVLLYGTSEQQPYKGIRFHLKTHTGPQKKDKSKDFTWHEWRVLGLASEGARLNLAPAIAQPVAALPPMPPVAPPGLPPMPPAMQPPTVPGGQAYAPPGAPGAWQAPPPGYPPQQPPQGYPPQQQPAPGFGPQPPHGFPPGMPWDPNAGGRPF